MSLFEGMIRLCEASDEVKRLIQLMKEHADELDFNAVDVSRAFPSDQLAQVSPVFRELIKKADPRRGMTEFQASYAVIKAMDSLTDMNVAQCMPAPRTIQEDIQIINEFLVDIAEEQCEEDVRKLLDRIKREISDVM